ncbi:hypothetical protein L915_19482 [Phytophthora nicotianae]|uniref:Uncharacterized protein n=1 Tax=Phytophthora nicotianae TaxID=4792 RepID=W2FUJ7_PHYNI|nr:hypothetical protein L915_19482 [Phytophthora nicotianae]
MAAPFQLRVVALVLRPLSPVAALPHIGVLLSSFLGPSSCLSLSEACVFGSIQLLDWIWESSRTSVNDRNPGWSLTNYLRSEPFYHQWHFREGLQNAARRGDVDMVKWFFDHCSGLEVPSEVVAVAAENGHLPVLQFLLENDQGRNCKHEKRLVELEEDTWEDSVPVMPEDWTGPGNVVRWGGHATREAVRNKHFNVVQWLDQHAPHQNSEEETNDIISVAANGGMIAFAESILPEGARVVEYLRDRAQSDAIQVLLDSNLVRGNQEASATAIYTLAREGNLDMMKQVAKLHSRKRMSQAWITRWEWGMSAACERGDLTMVKWMSEDRAGKEALRRSNDKMLFVTTDILQNAAKNGHIDVLEYLFQLGWADTDASTLIDAARGGRLECVKWLLENAPPYDEDNSTSSAVVAAAEKGHLAILQFFHDMDTATSNGPKRRRVEQSIEWWIEADKAMDKAAANGQLEVLKWIHSHRYDGCSESAMEDAARNGHLETLKWLHTNTTAGCTASAMDYAAFKGHLNVCKWLHVNRSEGCTEDAVRYAIGNGHLRVAFWLSMHYPQYIPEHNRLWKYPSNTFDMLLFLQVKYPTLFSLEFGRGTKSDLLYENKRGGDSLIAQWLNQKFPGHPMERHQLVLWPLM